MLGARTRFTAAAAVWLLVVSVSGAGDPVSGGTTAGRRGPATDTTAPVPPGPSGHPDVRVRYLDILERSTTGSTSAAGELAALESEAFEHGSLRAVRDLHRYQATMAGVLGAKAAGSLPALVWLQYQAGQHHRLARDVLSVPSRLQAAELAFALCRRPRCPDGERLFAEETMVSVASSFLQDNHQERAAGLFERVIAIDPDNRVARLGVASVRERQGDYERAVIHLEELLAAHPDEAEGRLRLAVNLTRLHERGRARQLLFDLADSSVAPWIRTVAFQELARAAMNGGGLDEAETTLRRALVELPTAQSLRLQLAVVVERRRGPAAAREIIDAVVPLPGREPSARWFYAQWPAIDLALMEGRLRATAESAAEVLHATLAARREESRS